MAGLIEFIALMSLFLFLAYKRYPVHIWLPVGGVGLAVATLLGDIWELILVVAWLVYVAAAIIVLFDGVRKNILTQPVFKIFKRLLPPISKTEQEALDAGDVWWDRELFSGQPHWQDLLNLPKPQLTAEEQAFLDNQVETLCKMLDDWDIVHERSDLSEEAWNYIKKERFLALVIDKQYGGLGFSALAHSTIVCKIATRSISAAVSVMVPNSLGPAEMIAHYGTLQQKKYYLPRLADGKEIPCFALTAPLAGSDAASIPDVGIVCKGQHEGKETLGIRLTFDKRYITLAPIATLIGLAFQMKDPDHLLGKESDVGITLCLIPADHPGVKIGTRHKPMDMGFMNGPLRGKDVFIPLDWIIGGAEMRGKGWRMMMECLACGRGISLPALSTAVAKLCMRTTGAYARIRKQFKQAIGYFEGIEEALARIGGYTYLCEATRRLTAHTIDQHMKPSVPTAMTKYHLTEFARLCINDAMDVHGGRGIQMGPRNYLGYVYTSIPISITVEGANILTRNLIIFGQGAMRCHPYLRKEIEAVQNSDTKEGVKRFDNLLLSHIGYIVCNFAKTVIYGFTGGLGIKTPGNAELKHYYRKLNRMSAALAFVSEMTMTALGADLKRRERLSARLGDVLSYLYMASAALKYHHDQGSPTSDLPFVRWSLDLSLHQTQMAFDDLFSNFPHRWLGHLLRWIVFPLGRHFNAPLDQDGHLIAQVLLNPSDLRNRLTENAFVSHDPEDAVGRLEQTFVAATEVEPLEKKVNAAVKAKQLPRHLERKELLKQAVATQVLTQDEAKQLGHFYDLEWDVLQVDEF